MRGGSPGKASDLVSLSLTDCLQGKHSKTVVLLRKKKNFGRQEETLEPEKSHAGQNSISSLNGKTLKAHVGSIFNKLDLIRG